MAILEDQARRNVREQFRKQQQENPCKKCGEAHWGCWGHSRKTGKPCGQGPVAGGKTCKYHGGHTPAALKVSEKRIQEELLRMRMTTYGGPRDVEPAEALLEEVRWTAGHVQWLREQVQTLNPDEITWGLAEETEKGATEFPGTDTVKKAAPSVWLQLYREERKHLSQICADCLRLGIEERRLRLAERQGSLIAEMIRKLLEDPELGLNPSQQVAGRAIASRHLRLLSGTA